MYHSQKVSLPNCSSVFGGLFKILGASKRANLQTYVLNQDMDSLTFIFVSCYNQCSSLGQNLKTSTYAWENLFAVFVSVSGLVLFALLIGNVQVNILNTDSLELPSC